MRLRTIGIALACLALLGGCSRRTYLVFLPAPKPVSVSTGACEVDRSGFEPGKTTLVGLRAIVERPGNSGGCGLKLLAHVNGESVDWQESSHFPDSAIVEMIIVEAAGASPSVQGPRVLAILRQSDGPGRGPVCPSPKLQISAVEPRVLPSRPTFIQSIPAVDLPPDAQPTLPEPPQKPLLPEDPVKKSSNPSGEGEGPPERPIQRLVVPAAAGGGLVYALCYLNLLSVPRRVPARARAPRRPPPDDTQSPAPVAAVVSDPNDLADRRVRIIRKAFAA